MTMNVQVGDASFTAALEEMMRWMQLIEMMEEGPVTIEMEAIIPALKRWGLWERVFLQQQPDDHAGRGHRAVPGKSDCNFYGSNSWSYTDSTYHRFDRLGSSAGKWQRDGNIFAGGIENGYSGFFSCFFRRGACEGRNRCDAVFRLAF